MKEDTMMPAFNNDDEVQDTDVQVQNLRNVVKKLTEDKAMLTQANNVLKSRNTDLEAKIKVLLQKVCE